MNKLSVSLVALHGVCVFLGSSAAGEPAPVTVRVAQDGKGDFNGADETPILEAIDRVGSGGLIVIAPGRYLIRRPLSLPSNVVLRGTAETVLRLPSPVLVTAPAAEGQQVVMISDVSQFLPQTTIEVFPPAGAKHFADGSTESFRAEITAAGDGRLQVAEGLPLDVPEGGRLGYPHNMVIVSGPSTSVTLSSSSTGSPSSPMTIDRLNDWSQGTTSIQPSGQ